MSSTFREKAPAQMLLKVRQNPVSGKSMLLDESCLSFSTLCLLRSLALPLDPRPARQASRLVHRKVLFSSRRRNTAALMRVRMVGGFLDGSNWTLTATLIRQSHVLYTHHERILVAPDEFSATIRIEASSRLARNHIASSMALSPFDATVARLLEEFGVVSVTVSIASESSHSYPTSPLDLRSQLE